ncbi:MAG TPA: CAP domain-containing protein [Actinomycetota bacterium]|jgi:uncharacterized protein YkwD|nr:CAP domain-containing protein [Actinomycetota bacterium]
METRSPRRAVRAAVLTLAAATLTGPTSATPAAAGNEANDWARFVPAPTDWGSVRPAVPKGKGGERELHTYINEARDRRGVRKLGKRMFLVRAARRHSRYMADTGQLVHSTDLSSYVGSRDWKIIGENIGYGPSMEVLHDAFMDSPPHRRNALDHRYKRIGVGMTLGDDGRIWVTVLFLG